MSDLENIQKEICAKYGYKFEPANLHLLVGIARGVQKDIEPVHALRHPAENNTTGWYIWTGEYSEAPDFFEPLHLVHLVERYPTLLPYLGLPAGCRVLLAEKGNYIDVWEDLSLLDI